MANCLSNDLIHLLRDKINDSGYVLQIYRNRNNSNYWNIICSAMDWIDVTIEGIDISTLSRQNDHVASRQLMTFLSCMDVMWESIQQLHRVFINPTTIPFKDDDTIFTHKLFPTTDNMYFKTIRACFAAHPVNLNDYFSGLTKKEQRYAGWSGGGFGKGDFAVVLYSKEIDGESLWLDIYFNELMDFISKRYGYLRTIMTEFDKQICDYKKSYCDTPIPKTNDPLNQIKILIIESEQRLGNDYYDYELKKMKRLFETPISSENNLKVVDRYRNALRIAIDEMHGYIQNMEEKELMALSSSHNYGVRGKYRYAYEKLCSYDYGIERYIVTSFQEELAEIIDFSDYSDFDELRVLIDAGLQYKFENEQARAE